MAEIQSRSALLSDVGHIHAIIEPYAAAGILLPRSIPELCENVRDFVVVQDGDRIVGCGALHLYGRHLAEIRSIAVAPDRTGRGIGRALVEALRKEADRHQVTCLCLFTRTPSFFGHLGFEIAQREKLPDKIYKDCIGCPRLLDCDEIAMVRGLIPPSASDLRDPSVPFRWSLLNPDLAAL